MKTKLYFVGFVILVAEVFVTTFLVGCRTTEHRAVSVSFPTHAAVDRWIGLTEWDAAYYSLNLSSNGTGTLTAAYAGESKVEYPVTSWTLKGLELRCEFGGNRPNQPSSLDGMMKGTHIVARLQGGRGWEEKVLFRREKKFLEEIDKIR
jgi:hypothetical protein